MWTFAINQSDLIENKIHRIYPMGIGVIIIKQGNTIYALSNQCPHLGCSLGGAILTDNIIQCPCHDWQFDITTGTFCAAKEIRLKTFETKTENDAILIHLIEDSI